MYTVHISNKEARGGSVYFVQYELKSHIVGNMFVLIPTTLEVSSNKTLGLPLGIQGMNTKVFRTQNKVSMMPVNTFPLPF